MLSDATTMRFIGEVKKTLDQTAKESMLFPKSDTFERGVQCGKYMGLAYALEILENVIRADDEKEKRS